jgi:hypothetical protein
MKRRTAVRNLGLALGSVISLPAWANAWSPSTLVPADLLALDEETLLAEICETILPETNTPGSKSLKVHQFVHRMIQDCLPEKAQDTFKKGLAYTDQQANKKNGQGFVNAKPGERKALLVEMSKTEDSKDFVKLVKDLTVRGYRISEYYQLNVLKYKMAPGFFHGSVPVE